MMLIIYKVKIGREKRRRIGTRLSRLILISMDYVMAMHKYNLTFLLSRSLSYLSRKLARILFLALCRDLSLDNGMMIGNYEA